MCSPAALNRPELTPVMSMRSHPGRQLNDKRVTRRSLSVGIPGELWFCMVQTSQQNVGLMLYLRLFGEVELLDEAGEMVPIHDRKDRAVFAYLMLADLPVDRAVLADLLWSGDDRA